MMKRIADPGAAEPSAVLADLDRLGPGGDEVYVALIGAHEGLTATDSARLDARLILLLANEVGDIERLKAAIVQARRDIGRSADSAVS